MKNFINLKLGLLLIVLGGPNFIYTMCQRENAQEVQIDQADLDNSLYSAVQSGNLSDIKELLERGAKPRGLAGRGRHRLIIDPKGRVTPLNLAENLMAMYPENQMRQEIVAILKENSPE